MENASKALIIAGAILITILLISLGVAIFQKASQIQEPVTSATETMAAATFNSQFLSYTGSNLSKTQVQMLLSKIIASNANSEKEVVVFYVESRFFAHPVQEDATVVISKLEAGGIYNVNATFGRDGYLCSVTIEKTSGG